MRQYFIISSLTFEMCVITIHNPDNKGKNKQVDFLDSGHFGLMIETKYEGIQISTTLFS